MRTTFKNSRSRLGNEIPQIDAKRNVYSMKRKREFIVNGVVSKKCSRAWGVVNYLPDRPDGEDDVSQASHIDRLQQQARLSEGKRNVEVTKTSMQKTFPDRRKQIILDMAKVEDVMKNYPTLACENEVGEFAHFV